MCAFITNKQHICVGGRRGLGLNEERDQTLNQLLTELDGFEARPGVLLLAATNRTEVIHYFSPGGDRNVVPIHYLALPCCFSVGTFHALGLLCALMQLDSASSVDDFSLVLTEADDVKTPNHNDTLSGPCV